MKKSVITIIVCCAMTICQAQEHLRFMGIPLDGTLDAFCNKLISEKGLVSVSMTEGEQYSDMETRKLTGPFSGTKSCTYYVRRHNRLDNVSSVIVEDTLSALSEQESKKLISEFDRIYGQHEKDNLLFVDTLGCLWNTPNGEVVLIFRCYGSGYRIFFTDYTEKDLRKELDEEFKQEWERQTVKEICGIPFGSSYEKTKEVLENKYGTPSRYSDRNTIVYIDKSYAGISFDKILFMFQSDGYKSYFNGCVFAIETKTLGQAKEKRDMLYGKLRWKYDITDGIGEDGIKYYYGGHSPIPFGGYGFKIDIVKFSDKSGLPYAARLLYGAYNYVTEEF